MEQSMIPLGEAVLYLFGVTVVSIAALAWHARRNNKPVPQPYEDEEDE